MTRFAQLTSLGAIMIAAGPALAENAEPDRLAGGNDVVVLSSWVYDPLYESGWSVDGMIGETDVVGPSGEQIGEVEDLVISDDGKVVAMIAEVGGFWDLGDTHVSIPWSEVALSPNLDEVRVPINEESADDYMLGGTRGILLKEEADRIVTVREEVPTGTRVFKATDLIGDYANLSDGIQYGYVNDLIVRNGALDAVVVDAQVPPRPGLYAYPYYADISWRPHGLNYQLPYTRDEIAAIDTFDYDRMRRTPDREQGSEESASN